MAIETVAVAGGAGNVGSTAITQLNEAGYRTVSMDVEHRLAFGSDGTAVNGKGVTVTRPDEFRRVDLLDAGAVFGALGVSEADAVIHVGTMGSATTVPWTEGYENQVMTSYNILEAARHLDVESVAIASSICAIGKYFAGPPPEIAYLPLDEEHPATPSEAYGLGKRVIEVTADGVGRLPGTPKTISTMRFAGVHGDDRLRSSFLEADRSIETLRETRDPADKPLFAYVHVEDAASAMCHAIQADFEGHETFWTAAADIGAQATTPEIVEAFYPETEIRGSVSGHDSLISTEKARRLLGWEPTRSFRDLA